MRLGAAIAGELVRFGCDHDEIAAGVLEEFDELYIGLLGRDVAIDQAKAEGESGTLGQIRLDELWPLCRDGFGDLGVAVSGQVGEVHLRLLALGSIGDGKEVNGACAARRGGDLRLL